MRMYRGSELGFEKPVIIAPQRGIFRKPLTNLTFLRTIINDMKQKQDTSK